MGPASRPRRSFLPGSPRQHRGPVGAALAAAAAAAAALLRLLLHLVQRAPAGRRAGREGARRRGNDSVSCRPLLTGSGALLHCGTERLGAWGRGLMPSTASRGQPGVAAGRGEAGIAPERRAERQGGARLAENGRGAWCTPGSDSTNSSKQTKDHWEEGESEGVGGELALLWCRGRSKSWAGRSAGCRPPRQTPAAA